MIHQLDIYGKDKVQNAIETLQFFEPKDGSGYWLAFSGGKDSVVVRRLMEMAGVKFETHYSVTSVDPPELVRFIKREYQDVIFDHQFYDDGTAITMWNLISKKIMPPTARVRYCCKVLKENGGNGRATVTGVRWAESVSRKNNQGKILVRDGKEEEISKLTEDYRVTEKGGIVLNNDNEETREVFETCIKLRKTTLNPIIDWTDDEVWEFIEEYKVPYCELYDEGFKRIGCIGCPLAGPKSMKRQFERWPKYKENYIRAMQRSVEKNGHRIRTWNTGEDMFRWWIREGEKHD